MNETCIKIGDYLNKDNGNSDVISYLFNSFVFDGYARKVTGVSMSLTCKFMRSLYETFYFDVWLNQQSNMYNGKMFCTVLNTYMTRTVYERKDLSELPGYENVRFISYRAGLRPLKKY